jgi:glycosyltransferase involved in cell wall biosynthesis
MHSAASVQNDEWYTRLFGCPESYADPVRQYELCKARGMDLVTLTDHDSIEGGLALMGRPDFFLSEEVTTCFPENGCVMHVLVWNVTPAQHKEMQELRSNIYHLSGYLRDTGLPHALAHPFLSSNWRLDAVTMEKALVLFSTLEIINGLVDTRTDASVAHLLGSLTPSVLESLARKHGLALPPAGARKPAQVAGSDDHAHRRCGTIYTECAGVLDPAAFLAQAINGQAQVVGTTATLDRMAAAAQYTTYQHFQHEQAHGESFKSPFVDFMDSVAGRLPAIASAIPGPALALAKSLLWATTRKQAVAQSGLDIAQTPDLPTDESDTRLAAAVQGASDAMLAKFADGLADVVIDFDIYGLLGVMPDLVGALVAITPMLFSADHLGLQEREVRRVWEGWTAFAPPKTKEYLAVFSDSLDKVDGVATWCARFGRQASKAGHPVWFASCGPAAKEGSDASASLPQIARFDLPLYPGFEITIPSLAATISRLWRERITHVEVSTPGPMGLVGLAAARLLRLPVTASYHTDLPDLIRTLTKEPHLANTARSYLGWFYRAVDQVFTFSEAARDKLVAMGVPGDKIKIMPVVVDPDDFSPAKSSPTAFSNLGIDARERPVILSVGRLSQEKNIPLVVDAVERLQGRPNPPLLVVVGDGPARDDLEASCRDKDFVVFLGFQQGEVLRRIFASAQMFVFASRVDTLGLVNLEALASGTPLLVPSDSAIAQSLGHDHTALFFQPQAPDLAMAITRVLDEPDCAARLGEAGRQHTLARWKDADFDQVWSAMVTRPNRYPLS